ncbi:hypothetical protein BT69DRAFT_1348100 [Atractiella rhizophila]|nr:hypothetical protein BT69DRAFT_1348100 [Atractiella rhizophila]
MSTPVIFFGASRGCAFYAALHTLKHTSRTCFLLLRKPDLFQETEEYKSLEEKQKSRCVIIPGDAFKKEDIQRIFEIAGSDCRTVVSSIGMAPSQGHFGLPKLEFACGVQAVFPVKDVCERSMATILDVVGDLHKIDGRKYTFIVVSSMGLGDEGHKKLVLPLKPYFGMISVPHRDKEAMEVLLCHSAGVPMPREYPEPRLRLASKLSTMPVGTIDLFLIWPAILLDGKEAPAEKVKELSDETKAYAINRSDIGAWIGRLVEKGDEEMKKSPWFGRNVVLATK